MTDSGDKETELSDLTTALQGLVDNLAKQKQRRLILQKLQVRPPNKNKKQKQNTNKQTIVHKTQHIKKKIDQHETRVENREWTSAWFLHFRKYN